STVTPGNTAPDVSLTTPVMEAWANAEAGARTNADTTTYHTLNARMKFSLRHAIVGHELHEAYARLIRRSRLVSNSFSVCKLTLNDRIRNFGCGGDPDALHLQILFQHLLAVFAPDSRALVAAKRRQVADRPVRVDPDGAGPQTVGHEQRAAHVLRPHAGR